MFSANSSQVSEDRLYVEDVFSTYLYTANNTTQTITNGIDLAGKGGLIWFKTRNTGGAGKTHTLVDSARGNNGIFSSLTSAQSALSGGSGTITLNSNGFTIDGGVFSAQGNINNGTTDTLVSWTFRKAPKFFDVVTYTGDGNGSGQTISHALGAVPGCIIIKPTSATGDWIVTSRKGASSYSYGLKLNATNAETGGWTGPSSTTTFNTFIGNTSNETNTNGVTYVAYLFAHDAASDGIIQCGSATCSGGVATINLGWEPQWILAKQTNTTGDWRMIDNMRGWTNNSGGNQTGLQANTSAAEASYGWGDTLSPTGCNLYGGSTDTFIYIAIRRGPMRTPTSGTSVFAPTVRTGNASATSITTGSFPPDMVMSKTRSPGGNNPSGVSFDRLRGITQLLRIEGTDAEFTKVPPMSSFTMTGYSFSAGDNDPNVNGYSYADYAFRRAPSFFDEVCYTGTGATRTVNHNLGVAPELIIIKSRNDAIGWDVEANFTSSGYSRGALNSGAQFYPQTYPDTITAQPTATQFSVSSNIYVGASNYTYVAYLFASCPGVSKVGSYTGNGSSQTINCGFAAGARFVMIKRTDSTGNWLVADSARGIVAGNDPLLYLNSTAAEVTSLDWIDADSSGFVVNQDSTANANVNGATYIYLAVA